MAWTFVALGDSMTEGIVETVRRSHRQSAFLTWGVVAFVSTILTGRRAALASRVVSAADLDKPIVGKKSVRARNDGTMKTVIDTGEFGTIVTDEPVPHGGTGTGPSPLQTVLGALCGCEGVTFNRTAAELGFAYEGIEFSGSYTIDIRGRLGNRAVRPHFQTVRLEARVFTAEGEERLREVVEETEARCPVFNLISDAGVKIETLWIREEID